MDFELCLICVPVWECAGLAVTDSMHWELQPAGVRLQLLAPIGASYGAPPACLAGETVFGVTI